jgi:cell wall-associated NlpC family hydrolase
MSSHSKSRSNEPVSRRGLLIGGGGVLALAGVAGVLGVELNKKNHTSAAPAATTPSASPSAAPAKAASYQYSRRSEPDRTVVTDANGGQVAVFTDGARTALLTGPSRTWTEPRTTTAVIQSTSWVRLMPTAWSEGRETSAWFRSWFPQTLGSSAPDVLGMAMQYEDKAPDLHNAQGVRYAGDAAFGPVVPGQSEMSFHYHDEKSDFYDYLGIPWTFQDGVTLKPDKGRYGDVDCSGYMRLVWGYRNGYPMHTTDVAGIGLPRRAFAIAQFAPGVLLIPDTKSRPTNISLLQPGDLVFFAINIGKPIEIDHCGMYLGPDTEGHPRFLSSRSQANGPTFGDMAGDGVLDGNGFYAAGLRVARRL